MASELSEAVVEATEEVAPVESEKAEEPEQTEAVEADDSEPVEEKKQEKTVEQKRQERVSAALSKIVRREQEVRRAQEILEERHASLERKAKLIEHVVRAAQVAQDDPAEALRQLGHDPDELFKRWGMAKIRGEQLTRKEDPTEALRVEIEQLKEERERERRAEQERRSASILERETKEFEQFVTSDRCKFASLKAFPPDMVAVDLLNVRIDHWHKTKERGRPVVLTEEAAAESLDRQYRALLENTERLKSALTKTKPGVTEEEAEDLADNVAKTLTGKHSAATRPSKRLTPQERLERAYSRLK